MSVSRFDLLVILSDIKKMVFKTALLVPFTALLVPIELAPRRLAQVLRILDITTNINL